MYFSVSSYYIVTKTADESIMIMPSSRKELFAYSLLDLFIFTFSWCIQRGISDVLNQWTRYICSKRNKEVKYRKSHLNFNVQVGSFPDFLFFVFCGGLYLQRTWKGRPKPRHWHGVNLPVIFSSAIVGNRLTSSILSSRPSVWKLTAHVIVILVLILTFI